MPGHILVEDLLGDGVHPGHRDPLALLDGQRVIGVLQLDQGALADGLSVDMCLEAEGGRRVRQVGLEPAKVRRL